MLEIGIWVFLFGVLPGVGLKVLLDKSSSDREITRLKAVISVALIIFAVIPITSKVGTEIAQNNAVGGFHEYWGGYELEANWEKVQCTKDGACQREYDCESYLCNPHDCNCVEVKDSKGNTISKSCSTCYDTCYHDCPYCTEEWTFVVKTTLGDYTIREAGFPDKPQTHRWRDTYDFDEEIPQYVLEAAQTGVPKFWQEVSDRVSQGKPGKVTKVREYVNYILASQSTILKQYSGVVDKYRAQGLLPTLSSNKVRDYYYADKVYGVGFRAGKEWQDANGQLNAALGHDLQGDLHVVIVQDSRVTNPDEYFGALMAYWLGPELGKQALSKNGIVVALGTDDGRTIKWARAQTGMPLGNEHMLQAIRSQLPTYQLSPEIIFGNPKAEYITEGGKKKVRVTANLDTGGALEKILWGPNKFKRICMTCQEEGGGGYDYLKDEIQPTGWQNFWITFVAILVSWIIWGAVTAIGYRVTTRRHYTYGY